MQDLFDYAERLGLAIEWAPLRGRDGEYRHDLCLIRLRYGMTERLERWTLAHEIGHAVHGDMRTCNDRVSSKQERRADEWAACRLIELHRYREVEDLRDGHVASMAHDLGIVSRGILAYQNVLERLGDHVYLKPQHGVGQFAARLVS